MGAPAPCDQKKCSVSKLAHLISDNLLVKLCFAGRMWDRGARLLPAAELEPKPCFWQGSTDVLQKGHSSDSLRTRGI